MTRCLVFLLVLTGCVGCCHHWCGRPGLLHHHHRRGCHYAEPPPAVRLP